MSLLSTASLNASYWDDLSSITLLIRIIVGLTFAAHGYKHIYLGGKLAGTARWFDSLGMKPNGMIASAETAVRIEMTGARLKRNGIAVVGRTFSLRANFTISASGCRRPNGPTRFGP